MPRFTIDMSKDIDKKLSELAKSKEITKGEVMRKAFALFFIAEEERERLLRGNYQREQKWQSGSGTRLVGL